MQKISQIWIGFGLWSCGLGLWSCRLGSVRIQYKSIHGLGRVWVLSPTRAGLYYYVAGAERVIICKKVQGELLCLS